MIGLKPMKNHFPSTDNLNTAMQVLICMKEVKGQDIRLAKDCLRPTQMVRIHEY